ncbi:transposase zinc-binding domain-containing protein [Clostridium sp. D2Q-14]|uniref:transposase zinc-binding domain-containing protein n=1 Tax=Anaeromonas gelatinilytica TaxID=2683194 RepID=UPI00193AF6D6|nr:transposase zinc-binding domain-containing protein [Anaeromonas gelatinilytica]MBS4536670.1 transposase zinc-binding domain-containing protein [Anaeromonas gelatinilytica]
MASKLKKIFIDHWERFVELYEHKIRKSVIKAVEKMINYGSLEKGYIIVTHTKIKLIINITLRIKKDT